MRAASLVVALCAFAACGDGHPGKSICDNTIPPPAACMTQCDPSPSAPNTCPSGYHCAPDGFCDALCSPTGNECGDGYICTPDGRCKGENECEGLECNIVACTKQGKPETTIKGTVFAPNGTLPLYNIRVYVPNAPLPAFGDGASCARCDDTLPGNPVVTTTTDENGNFTLSGAPSGTDIPLVITSGKWRRQIKIPAVAECTDNMVAATDSRLPKNQSEGDIPKIALSTGHADSLECLLRRMGIDDSEIGTDGGTQRIQLYTDNKSDGEGVDSFKAGFAGGSGTFAASKTLWGDVAKLKSYDIVIFSCEGGQHLENMSKTQADLDNLKAYADFGGRVFLSHWHNVWISGGYENNPTNPPKIASWAAIANWVDNDDTGAGTIDGIDVPPNNPKGNSFQTWMKNVEPTSTMGEIKIQDGTGKTTCTGINNNMAERWTFIKKPTTFANRPQNFQFTTPIETDIANRCGKVVFSDMHVSGSGGSPSGADYPDSCGDPGTPAAMTAQEKALAFMLFDLASCIGVLL